MLVMTCTTGYTYYRGLGEVVYEAKTYIAQNLFFEEHISINERQAVEHTFTTEVQSISEEIVPYVFVGDVTGKCNLTYMKGLLKEEGYTVVAGVNGDFYDTITGVPLGMSIHEGKIKNSGLNFSSVIGFKADGTAFVSPIRFDYSFTVNEGNVFPFHHINKPKGSSDGIYFYNSQYAASTRTQTSGVEVVLTAIEGTEPSVDGLINAQVASVNANTMNTPIGENQIVLSAPADTESAAILASLVPEDRIVFSVTDQTGVWGEAKEAIGAYQVIALDGFVTTTDQTSQPRTCLGIKADGSYILFAADGRNPGYATGMNLTEVASYLIEKGCVHVVNLDGGGSTSMMIRMPGDPEAMIVNKPSDGKERSVSNGLLLVVKDEAAESAQNIHLYPLTTFMLPGTTRQMSIKATDDNYRAAYLSDEISYDSDSNIGSIDENGLFTAGSRLGEGSVEATADRMRTEARIVVTQDISINPSLTDIVIEPEKSIDINVRASYRYVPVVSRDDLFIWTCDAKIGSIDQNGVFKATARGGQSGKIYIAYNGTEKSIPVRVGASKVSFDDTNGHWAQKFIELLAGMGMVQGMGDNLFLPDAQLTKAQFLTMLSNSIIGLDVTLAPPADFSDLDPIEWYVPYVNWGYASKIVNGNPDGTYAPNSPITREQMAVILNNFAASTGITYKPVNGSPVFTDNELISIWAQKAVDDVTSAGIMNGRPEGNYDPQGLATRAEATKVIYSVVTIMEN
jgi:hypothetical protein